MISDTVCAIIVTFHPDREILEHLSKLRQQMQHIVVVDNGSSPAEMDLLRVACRDTGSHLIENGENLGIAAALNIGIRHALTLGSEWVLLFDQDSCVTPGFVEAMLHGFTSSRWGKQLAVMVPQYVDKRLGSIIPPPALEDTSLSVAMTSGSLIPMSILLRHGLFEEGLFIDVVDTEHSFRLRSLGYRIARCPSAVLLHSPGTPTLHKFCGRTFSTNNYSPLRRYYQERNTIWLTKRYWKTDPTQCIRFHRDSLSNYVHILFLEENKWKKLRACFLGVVDGVREKMGRKDDL